MKRPLLNLLTALSLLPCLAAVALWVRSYSVADVAGWDLGVGRGMLGVASSRGRLMVCRGYEPFGSSLRMHRVDGWADFQRAPVALGYARYDPRWVLARPVGFDTNLDLWRRPMFGDNRKFWPGGWRAAPKEYETHLDRAGLVYQSGHQIYLPRANIFTARPVAGLTHRAVVVPMWFVAISSALPAAVSVTRRLWQRRPRSPGLCRRCGYDLRASPGRCPECGTPAASAPRAGA